MKKLLHHSNVCCIFAADFETGMNKLGIIASAVLAFLYFKQGEKKENTKNAYGDEDESELLFNQKDAPTEETHTNVYPSLVSFKPIVRFQLNEKDNLVTKNKNLVAQAGLEFKRNDYKTTFSVLDFAMDLYIKGDDGNFIKVCLSEKGNINTASPGKVFTTSSTTGKNRTWHLNWSVIKFPSKAYRTSFLEKAALTAPKDGKSKLVYADYTIRYYEGYKDLGQIRMSDYVRWTGTKVPCSIEYIYKALIS